MLNMFCSNPDCRWHTEKRGGSFHFVNGSMLCADCYFERPVLNDGKNLWDFETTHLNGKPVAVKSLSHLRELEKKHGVRSVAANMDSRNWSHAPQTQDNRIR